MTLNDTGDNINWNPSSGAPADPPNKNNKLDVAVGVATKRLGERQSCTEPSGTCPAVEHGLFSGLPLSGEQTSTARVIEHQFFGLWEQTAPFTSSTIVYGAWALVVDRIVNSQDIMFFATTSTNPKVAGNDETTALTATPIPIQIKVPSDQRVLEYLKTIQEQMIDMCSLQGAKLEQTCNIASDKQHAWLFRTLLGIQLSRTRGTHDIGWDDHQMQQLDTYGLVLQVYLGADKTSVLASFDSADTEPLMVQNLLRDLDYVVSQLNSIKPNQLLTEIKTTALSDLEQIWEWNSSVPVSIEQCVHEIIEKRAQAQPDTIALCSWDGELTYRELDRLATRLSTRLSMLGIGPGNLVPLCFEKSMWTAVAMLGVMKAGGAFVLLDSSLPEQRLRAIVQQVKASLILSSLYNQNLTLRLAQEVLIINSGFFTDQVDEGNYCSTKCSSASAIYVTFTSGSTGTPKGVIVTHQNFSTAIFHQVDSLGLSTKSRVYDFASYSFDISASYTLMTLATGGCLCIPSDQDRRDNLQRSISQFRANAIVLTPSIAQLLSPEEMPELQSITLVGEASRVTDVKRWWDKVRVINRYGVSECTAACTINCSASCPEEAIRVGKGVGLVTWVVDQDNHDVLLPLGRVGELLLEGPLVSRGYLNNPERTAMAFIDDPIWLVQGVSGRQGRHGKLYKTGDLVRYSEDGSLTFIGRKDTQVKIRGQRVELGEVEHCVQNCMPEPTRVVAEVILPRGENSSPTLVAFLQMDGNAAEVNEPDGIAKILPIPIGVEEKLAKGLPNYMVPTIFLCMRELPMTATGKMNRKKLREIGGLFSAHQLAESRTGGQEPKTQPTSEVEQLVQNIWAQVLDIDAAKVGLNDSFFHLGGDSIAAMRVVVEARKVGIKLTVADIFRHRTLYNVANGTIHSVYDVTVDLAPFALLGDGVDVASVIRDISTQYQLDSAKILDIYSCTPLQEGLMSLTSQRSGDYIKQSVFELSSNIRLTALCTAWEEVARVMPILRTRIIQHSERGLVQVVLDEHVQWIDEIGLDRYLEANRKQTMDLGEPLTRYALVRDGAGIPKWFVWTIHHALYDGWSMRLIMGAVNQVYRGEPIDQGHQFQAFVKYVKDQDDEKILNYWRNALEDCECSPFPALPPSVDQPRADNVVHHEFPTPQRRSKNNTISATIRAAWAVLVSQMTNSEDVVFGATVWGRSAPIPGIETIAAPTIATVPVRIKVSTDQSVWEYLNTVQQQLTEMIPFEQGGLQRMSKICPGARQACMFQTLLVIQAEEPGGIQDAQDVICMRHEDNQMRQFNTYGLVIEVQLGADKITSRAFFDQRMIEPWVVQKLLNRLEHVLHQLFDATPTTVLSGIETTTADDLKQIWEWNDVVPTADERCVHDIIASHAQFRFSAPAICAWDGELTYGDLNDLAMSLGSWLVSLGVGANTLVPLCFEKSMWVTVAMLGVLKAGGGFILLDPSLPEQRLQDIIQQVKPSLALSSPTNQLLCSRLCSEVTILSSEFFTKICHRTIEHLPGPSSESIAYVVFTSGSTGKPKGVVIPHRSLSSAVLHQANDLTFTKESRVFDASSHSFDATIHNTFLTLAVGGCLCIPNDRDRKDNLAKSIASLRVTVAALTPSTARLLSPEQTPGLQTIIFGGEALHVKDITRWWGSTARVINMYGPSECTPISTINAHPASAKEATHIGKGAGLVTWIVDSNNHNSLLPPGCIGELLLEGPLVGYGYLNNREKTTTSFINDPEWLIKGGSPGQRGRHGRLYKTGDLVQYNKDGSLLFIGRKDGQVKIRGQRVELGEVEHHLRACIPGAHQVAAEVIVPGGKGANPTLMAFLVCDVPPDECADVGRTGDGAGAGAGVGNGMLPAQVKTVSADVDHELAKRLPSYMIPTVYFALDKLPINSSGKTDRRRLHDLGASFTAQQLADLRSGSQADNDKRSPLTGTEFELQKIWAHVLNIDAASIGADDSFFRLGGDSITAMQASAAARASNIDISTADVLQKKTISLLAATAASIPTYHLGQGSMGVEEDDGKPFQLSPIQLLYVMSEPDPTRCFDQNFLLKLRAPVLLSSVARAIETIVSRHSMLRARFNQTCEGRWEQRISKDALGSFHLCEEGSLASFDLEKDIHIRRCRERLNIESGPLLAAVLLKELKDGASQSIFIAVHHLVIDLVSWRVILQELEEILTGVQLSAPPRMSFRTWCSMQAQYAAEHLGYEAAEAVKVPPPLLSYWGFDARTNATRATTSKSFVLDEKSSAEILGPCNKALATRPVELIIAALTHSFRNVFTDRPSPVVFREGHGREPWDDRIDLSRTIGWFTTISPVYAQIAQDQDLLETVRYTKDFIRMLPRNGWSYFAAKFATESNAVASASEYPVELMFNYTGSYQQLERGDSFLENYSTADECDPESFSGLRRLALFDVRVQINRGRLAVTIGYPVDMWHQERIVEWVDKYQVTLSQIAVLLRDRPLGWTLADFPMAFASYDAINEFQHRVLPRLGISGPEDIEDIYPCTPLQEHFLEAQAKDSRKYRIKLGLEICSLGDRTVDLSRIEQAWRAVVRRHSLLRAILVDGITGASGTMHIVLKDPVPNISYFESSKNGVMTNGYFGHPSSPGYKRDSLQHHLSVYQTDVDKAEIRLEINHAICDAHSIGLLLHDLQMAFNDTLDLSHPLYANFINHIRQQPRTVCSDFWTNYLDSMKPCLIPTREDALNERSTIRIGVPNVNTSAIHSFCSKWEVTAATLIQTAWAMVLHQYTGSTLPCFGNLVSRRDLPVDGVTDMFGPLMFLVPCRVQFGEPRSMLDALRSVNEDFIRGLSSQTISSAEIQKALNVGGSKLFNTAISFQRVEVEAPRTHDGYAIHLRNSFDPVEWDVYVRATDSYEKLEIELEYWEERISNNTGADLAECLGVALSLITSNQEENIQSHLGQTTNKLINPREMDTAMAN